VMVDIVIPQGYILPGKGSLGPKEENFGRKIRPGGGDTATELLLWQNINSVVGRTTKRRYT